MSRLNVETVTDFTNLRITGVYFLHPLYISPAIFTTFLLITLYIKQSETIAFFYRSRGYTNGHQLFTYHSILFCQHSVIN